MFQEDSFIWLFHLMWCVRRTNGVASIYTDVVVIIFVFVLHDILITQSDDILHESNFQNVKSIQHLQDVCEMCAHIDLAWSISTLSAPSSYITKVHQLMH